MFCLSIIVISILLQGCSNNMSLESFQDKISSAVNSASSGIVSIYVVIQDNPDRANTSNSKRIGAGIIIDPTGTLVTTYTIIEGFQSLIVMYQDGCSHKATVVGIDKETNLAILKSGNHEHGCFPVPIELSSVRNAGTIGLIMGNTTFSKGIATSWGVLCDCWMGGDDFISDPLYCIQAGELLSNSGTAVVDITGKLIGICDNFISGNRSIWTIIPSTTIVEVAKRLTADGKIDRGWLGIVCQPDPNISLITAASANFRGVQVTEVLENSPAHLSGIIGGERIVSISGVEIAETSILRKKITGISPQDPTTLILLNNNGELREFDVKLTTLSYEPDRQRHCPSRSM